MAISNVPWFATTVEGPFGVGTGGIFATIVRVVQAFVCVWVIIKVNIKFILPEQTGSQYSHQYNIIIYCYIDTSVLPPVKFIKTTFGTGIDFRTCQQSPLKLRRIVENCFKWTWKNPKNFTCTIVSIAFVPWLTGASEWSLSVITPSIFMTAIICSVALIYVWRINPVDLKVLVRENINMNTAKMHYLSY